MTTLIVADELVSASDLATGGRVLLFLGDAVDAGDGVLAYAPNVVYHVDAGLRARSHDDRHDIPLEAFIDLIKAHDP